MQDKIILKGVRLNFPSIFSKSIFQGKVGKYEGTFIVDKDDEQIKEVIGKIQSIRKQSKKKIAADKLCISDGDNTGVSALEGTYTIKASNIKQPIVLDERKQHLTQEDGKVYSGVYVNAFISLWLQDNQFGQRVNANLLGIQFVRHGDPLGGEVVNEDEILGAFDEIPTDDAFDEVEEKAPTKSKGKAKTKQPQEALDAEDVITDDVDQLFA